MRVGRWGPGLLGMALAASLVLIAGCGSTVDLPNSFSSTALGVSLRYPASWHLSLEPVKKGSGEVTVTAPGDGAGVSVDVVFVGSSPFGSFSAADDQQLSETKQADQGAVALLGAHVKIIQVSLQTVGGLRLVESEDVKATGGPKWHEFQYDSGYASSCHLEVNAGYTDPQAAREKATVEAILASMHFSQPRG